MGFWGSGFWFLGKHFLNHENSLEGRSSSSSYILTHKYITQLFFALHHVSIVYYKVPLLDRKINNCHLFVQFLALFVLEYLNKAYYSISQSEPVMILLFVIKYYLWLKQCNYIVFELVLGFRWMYYISNE